MAPEKTSVIKVSKRLDASNVGEFKARAIASLGENEKGVIIDFEETAFIDSAGLGSLVSILKHASQSGGRRVALASLSTQVRQIFELTKLYRLFDIYENPDKAAADLAAD
jgi:anti-sigma B factor antagonist